MSKDGQPPQETTEAHASWPGDGGGNANVWNRRIGSWNVEVGSGSNLGEEKAMKRYRPTTVGKKLLIPLGSGGLYKIWWWLATLPRKFYNFFFFFNGKCYVIFNES